VDQKDLLIKHLTSQREIALNALAASNVQLELAMIEIESLRKAKLNDGNAIRHGSAPQIDPQP
jgi:hypothetical protein